MSDSTLYDVIMTLIAIVYLYLKFNEWFGPQRVEPIRDSIGLAVSLTLLAAYFMATVFDHPEARIGWLIGVVCGLALGLFDLRVTQICNSPGGVLAYSSRLVTALFLAAGSVWSASHGGRRELSVANTSDSPASMFFCTTLLTYLIVYINGLYSGRRFESAGRGRKAREQRFEPVEYGRRRGRR